MKTSSPLRRRASSALASSLVLASGLALAGPTPMTTSAKDPIAPEDNGGDWCDWLSSKPGTLFKDKENPYLSEIRVFGRVHLQAAYVDGDDVNGDSFHSSYTEIRRFRFGAGAKFLRYFEFKSNLNLENDRFPNGDETDHDIEYANFHDFVFTFDLEKAFNLGQFDALELGYGKRTVRVGLEGKTSSNKIRTVERSAIANKATVEGDSNNPVGVWVEGEKGKWGFDIGVFSSGINDEIGGWNDGIVYYGSLSYDMSDALPFEKSIVSIDYVNNENRSDSDDDVVGGEDWVGAINFDITEGPLNVETSLYAGENNGTGDRDGGFYGVVVMPTYDFTDKLQGVVRYQYAKAEEAEGVRLNSRYIRRDARHGGDVNSGRGDEHHSIYAGLNYYFCSHNLKVLTGVEYDTIDTPAGDVDATTLWLALRTTF